MVLGAVDVFILNIVKILYNFLDGGQRSISII